MVYFCFAFLYKGSTVFCVCVWKKKGDESKIVMSGEATTSRVGLFCRVIVYGHFVRQNITRELAPMMGSREERTPDQPSSSNYVKTTAFTYSNEPQNQTNEREKQGQLISGADFDGRSGTCSTCKRSGTIQTNEEGIIIIIILEWFLFTNSFHTMNSLSGAVELSLRHGTISLSLCIRLWL
jgi:hypothetical protein